MADIAYRACPTHGASTVYACVEERKGRFVATHHCLMCPWLLDEIGAIIDLEDIAYG